MRVCEGWVIPAIGASVASSATVVQSGTTQVVVTVTRINFTGPITLSAEGLSAGVTAGFAPATVPNGTTVSALTLTASSSAPLGAADVTIRATGPAVGDATMHISVTVTQ